MSTEGSAPLAENVTIAGYGAAWNYTMGPAFKYRGPKDIAAIQALHMPVVLIARRLGLNDVGRMEMTRLLGFVVEQGGAPDMISVFFEGENRATVTGAADVFAQVAPRDIVIVDGVEGKVIIRPDEATRAHYEELRRNGPPKRPGSREERMTGLMTSMMKDFKHIKLDPKGPGADSFRLGTTISAKVLQGVPLEPKELEAARKDYVDDEGKPTPALLKLEEYQKRAEAGTLPPREDGEKRESPFSVDWKPGLQSDAAESGEPAPDALPAADGGEEV